MVEMKPLTLKDILLVLAFPYVLMGYAVLCILYAPYEFIKEKIKNT